MGRVAKFKDDSAKKLQKQIILLIMLVVAGGVIAFRQFSDGGPSSAIADDLRTEQAKKVPAKKTTDVAQPLSKLTINNHLSLASDPFDIDESQYEQISVPDVEITEPVKPVTTPAKPIDPKEIQKTFRVQAIFGRDVARALINGKVHEVGDQLRAGVFIERIDQRVVTLKAGNHRINIKLDKE